MACIPRCMGQRPTFIAMMFLTTSFFFVEIVVGYITNSMALVADSFHMLSDIISLFVGFFALKFSRKSTGNVLIANTFGFVRAEVLGALVNAVFLLALCFSILIEALKRLVEPEELKDPLMILGVGGAGLLINVIGMFLFHGHTGHGHSHGGGGHGHSHGGGGHSHSNSTKKSGHSHKSNGHGHSHEPHQKCSDKEAETEKSGKEVVVFGHQNDTFEEEKDHEDVIVAVPNNNDITIEMYLHTSETAVKIPVKIPVQIEDSNPKKGKAKSSGQMNMRGVYLHILGDALGSVIVVVAALLVHFFDGEWTLYVDPVLSIALVGIILNTTIPLLKESSLILLQNVPSHIKLQKLEERLLTAFPEIIAVHEFHVWQLTGSKIVASLHIKFHSQTQYKILSSALKEFFHEEGIHSTTVQPEFVEANDKNANGKACLLACVSKSCEEKVCCKAPNEKKNMSVEEGHSSKENSITDSESKPATPTSTRKDNDSEIEIEANENDKVQNEDDATEVNNTKV